MLRTLLFAISLVSVVSCSTLDIDVPMGIPNEPIVTVKPDAFGIPVTKVRPNPVCMTEGVKDENGKVLLPPIGEPACGYYVWTISDRHQLVGENPKTWLFGKPWSKLKAEAIYTPSESQAKIKAGIINTCKKYSTCDQKVRNWRVKTDRLIPTKP